MAIDNKKYGKPIFNHKGFKIVPVLKSNKNKVKSGNRFREKEQKGYSGEYVVLSGKREYTRSKDIEALKRDINNY